MSIPTVTKITVTPDAILIDFTTPGEPGSPGVRYASGFKRSDCSTGVQNAIDHLEQMCERVAQGEVDNFAPTIERIIEDLVQAEANIITRRTTPSCPTVTQLVAHADELRQEIRRRLDAYGHPPS